MLNTLRTSLLLLVVLVLGLYYPALFSPLNSIDDPGIYSYLLNSESFGLAEIFSIRPSSTYYRPILWLSFAADKHIWGLEESFMHLENMVFHLLNTFLVYFVARRAARLLQSPSTLLPLLTAVFFAIHPINSEPVNWIAGRTDLLACIFVLSALLLLLRTEPDWRFSALATLYLVVGCLAKETAIFFLPMALVLPFFLPRPSISESLTDATFRKYLFPQFLLLSGGVAFLVCRSLIFPKGDAGVSRVVSYVAGGEGYSVLENLRLAFKAAGFYLKKLFLPFPLNFGIIHVSDFYLVVGIVLSVLLVWLLTRRTLTVYFFLCAASVGASAVMVPLLQFTWTPLAERYLYIPSAFFIIGSALLIDRLWQTVRYPMVVPVSLGVVFLVFVAGTFQRNLLWQDNLALLQDTKRKSPYFVPIQNEVAIAHLNKGANTEAATAINSLLVVPSQQNSPLVLLAKANVLIRQKDFEHAVILLEMALAEPDQYEERITQTLLKLYDQQIMSVESGHEILYSRTVPLLARLYALNKDPFNLYRLGQAYLFLGDRAQAQKAFSQAAAEASGSAYYRIPAQKLAATLLDEKVK